MNRGTGEDAGYCPLPLSTDAVVMAHGAGGRLTAELIDGVFAPALGTAGTRGHDAAVLAAPPGRLAFTTDGYVVQPLFFPGGDIGRLAVYGTVNDLAMAGARPLWLTAAFVLEEGLPLATLRAVVASMAEAARAAGVRIVAGDTKVVERGRGDGLHISTAGIGVVADGVDIGPARIRAGDRVLISGDIGRHGLAVLTAREALGLEGALESDCAPLAGLAAELLATGADLHCLRDLTRGGLGAALCELAVASGLCVHIEEAAIAVSAPVRAACELLGLEPLHLACEGRLVAFVDGAQAPAALAVLRRHDSAAAQIGVVHGPAPRAEIVLTGALGTQRVLDLPAGELLPRIC